MSAFTDAQLQLLGPINGLVTDALLKGIAIIPQSDGSVIFRGTAVRYPEIVNELRRRTDGVLRWKALCSNWYGACRHCRSGNFVESIVFGGKAVRRDCSKCGRFSGFPIWHLNRSEDEPGSNAA
jgi:hypothetical protein